MNAYCIRDLKGHTWDFPFPGVNHATTMRSLHDRIQQQPDWLVARYPEDFELYYCGSWEQDSWDPSFLESPEFLCSLDNLVTPDAPPIKEVG